ncbi:rRNA maturation RNase YbeY [Paludibacter sp.]
MIQYINEDVKAPLLKKREVSTWIKNIAKLHGRKTGDIAFIFCNDDKIIEINRKYLQHDFYTDIITFDYSYSDIISGDIFISIDTVKTNAEKYKVAFNQELHRVIIHGILHLCGRDDQSADDKAIMKEEENKALDILFYS